MLRNPAPPTTADKPAMVSGTRITTLRKKGFAKEHMEAQLSHAEDGGRGI